MDGDWYTTYKSGFVPCMCKEEATQGNHLVIPSYVLEEQQQPQKLSNEWENAEQSPGLSLFPPTCPLAWPGRAGPGHKAPTASHKKWEMLACLRLSSALRDLQGC